MEPLRLRQLFARTLRASLASPLVLAGCGIIDLEGYSAPSCEDGYLAVTGLNPAVPPDFVQLRNVYTDFSPNPPHRGPNILNSSGTACATASQPSVCQSALDALTTEKGFLRSCGNDACTNYFLATTRGDDVAAIDTLDGLRSFLGTIDTAQEAALLAFAQGYNLSCNNLARGAVRADADGGFHVITTQGHSCGAGSNVTRHILSVSPSGDVKEESSAIIERGNPGCAIGRRPQGLRAADGVACAEALGRHFAAAAHLEAASIQAFLRLREELALHGADESLQDAALASALEEVMHTQLSTRLAHRFGATPPRPQVEALPLRSLFEVALDNAVEGCTRETYGALVAHHQALHARDEQVRGAMARIAEDETRHAELSWAIDRWAHTRLSESERATLREARRAAVAALRAEVATPPDADLVTEAGIPTPEVAASLLTSLEQSLWA
ncbi:ferritin-like domain-containing protein [Cystobacter ferrugineus]|uniref:Ferritin n=1 Tax=Cystobacter ferrugineus TaxID=83449 RepID=A0A1L9BBF4_9BACT|nr:ferritin-like domain-containing protein [Cystobacter ferrugineus]OJH39594.1 ferritin [Cystobacter ferrugineus]